MSPRVVLIYLLLVSGCSALPPARPETSPSPAPPAQAAVAVPLPPPRRPVELVGLSREEAGAVLGRPRSVGDLASAIQWAYREGPCSLSLLFYPEAGTDTWRVATYEIRGGPEAACLSRIRDAHGRAGK